MKNEIIIKNIMETTYKNGTHWIEYTVDGKYGYMIVEEADVVEVEVLQSWIDDKKFNPIRFYDKKDINNCSPALAEIIINCLQSENEMWFVEYEDITEEEALKISDEVNKLGIGDYVRFDEDDCAITVYGGVITEFLF